MTPVTISEIAAALESWAPAGHAAAWDNSGLQVGRPGRTVSRAIVALDCTPQVVREARETEAELIVTHHPLLFKPPRTLTDRHPVSAIALDLAEAGIGLYSIHTNLDAARGGVSFALAAQLGLTEVTFLKNLDDRPLRKLVVYVPESHAEAIRRAMGSAGAGRIGEYDNCAFEMRGTGWFTPRAGARPFIGTTSGSTERVDEVRLEAEAPTWDLPLILSAVRAVHPYEEIAYDVFPVEQPSRNAGIGAVGNLPSPETLARFLERVSEALQAPALRFLGDPLRTVTRVAVCGGSGVDYLPSAITAGADAYVTADITYHRWFEALNLAGEPRLAVVDPGHYETEAVTERLLVDFLAERFTSVEWRRTTFRTSPVGTFVR